LQPEPEPEPESESLPWPDPEPPADNMCEDWTETAEEGGEGSSKKRDADFTRGDYIPPVKKVRFQ